MTYKQELGRKAIHLGSSFIPVGYWFISRELALMFVIPMAVITVVMDYGRNHWRWADRIFSGIFGYVMREDETDEKKLTGGSYVMIAEVMMIAIFPKPIAIAGLLMLSAGDTAAALVGRAVGKHVIYRDKTWEGTFAFVIISTFVAALVPGIPLYAALAASTIAALVELYFTAMDDNIFIPLSAGIVLVLLLVT